MNKDVIYIDVEDDITAIIGKVKASKENVVALVPPKRIGVLQSAVNLRLLNRAAKQADKKLALITNNQSLVALAGAATIPVAKNLQSTPELAEVAALDIDDGDDVIDGAELPVGEHAAQAGKTPEKAKEDKSAAMAAALAEAPKSDELPAKPKVKKKSKVPNFDKFRKKMILIIILALALIGFLVWAIFFAPRATVIIKAKTASTLINSPVSLSTSADTSLDDGTIKATMQQSSDDKSVEFNATGKKDAGKKATGTVKLSNQKGRSVGVPAGTKLKSNDLTYTTDSSVDVPGANVCPEGGICAGSTEVSVTAAENGSKYNAASGSASGAPDGVSASFTDPTSGGVTKNITIVTANDVQNAKQKLVNDDDSDDIKKDLASKFPDDATVIDESFAVDYGDVSSSPSVGDEADSNAKLSAKVTYKLYAVEKDAVDEYLDAYLKKELDGRDDQRVYKNGDDKITLQDAKKSSNGANATLIATAQVGPKIDDNKVKDQAKGKKYGEIQQSIESIQGVESVDVKFFPFWVSKVPNNNSRISVEFKLDESR